MSKKTDGLLYGARRKTRHMPSPLPSKPAKPDMARMLMEDCSQAEQDLFIDIAGRTVNQSAYLLSTGNICVQRPGQFNSFTELDPVATGQGLVERDVFHKASSSSVLKRTGLSAVEGIHIVGEYQLTDEAKEAWRWLRQYGPTRYSVS